MRLDFTAFLALTTITAAATTACSAAPAPEPASFVETTGATSPQIYNAAGSIAASAMAEANERANEEAYERERERRAEEKREMEARAYPNSPDVDGDGAYDVKYGGTDCCDTDPNAYPGAERFFTSPDACGSYDYDCSGSIEPEYGVASAEKTHLLSCGTGGFASETACGESNTLTTYKWKFGCKEETSEATQGCR